LKIDVSFDRDFRIIVPVIENATTESIAAETNHASISPEDIANRQLPPERITPDSAFRNSSYRFSFLFPHVSVNVCHLHPFYVTPRSARLFIVSDAKHAPLAASYDRYKRLANFSRPSIEKIRDIVRIRRNPDLAGRSRRDAPFTDASSHQLMSSRLTLTQRIYLELKYRAYINRFFNVATVPVRASFSPPVAAYVVFISSPAFYLSSFAGSASDSISASSSESG